MFVTNPSERKILDQLFAEYKTCEKCGATMEHSDDWYNVDINTAIYGGIIDMKCPKCGHVHTESISFDPKFMPTMYQELTNRIMRSRRDEVLSLKSVGGASTSTASSQQHKAPRNIQEAALQRLQRKGKK